VQAVEIMVYAVLQLAECRCYRCEERVGALFAQVIFR
jgi:hypothetical protein